MRNTAIRDLTATGKIFQAVSSTIEIYAVTMKRIQYSLVPVTSTSGTSSSTNSQSSST
jgi:hypothetical protein